MLVTAAVAAAVTILASRSVTVPGGHPRAVRCAPVGENKGRGLFVKPAYQALDYPLVRNALRSTAA